jgi:RimJ/RimL family protein N-acetyltransferase
MLDLPKKVKLKDGRIAVIDFLKESDSAEELRKFINSIIAEDAFLIYNRKTTMKEEKEWKKNELKKFRERTGFLLIAKINRKIVGSSGAGKGPHRAKGNVELGIAISKEGRGIGLGEVLLRTNIRITKKFLTPKNIYLTAFELNKPALSLYKKLGFKEIAKLPEWLEHGGKYCDQIVMKLY